MAVAAALMALRPDMSGTEKWLWAAVLLMFAVVEMRAIQQTAWPTTASSQMPRKRKQTNFKVLLTGLVNPSRKATNILTTQCPASGA